MAQKAGRVGVDPSQVDLFGKIVGGGGTSDAYTKAEADDKFLAKTDASNTYETQAHASSTYETKAEAADLQPKNLAVPIHMLSGSILTVEGMFAGDQDAYSKIFIIFFIPYLWKVFYFNFIVEKHFFNFIAD